MAESFENLDNILRGWAKHKVQKSLVKALDRFEKQEEERQSRFFEKRFRKTTRAVSVGCRVRLNQAQNWSGKAGNHCFISNLTNPIDKTFRKEIYLQNSTFPSLNMTVDTLMDVRNETWKKITFKIS